MKSAWWWLVCSVYVGVGGWHLHAIEGADTRNVETLNKLFWVDFHHSLPEATTTGVVHQHVDDAEIGRGCGKGPSH